MNAVGIVAEYNPFHKGHAYQIEQTKKIIGNDTAIICVMSGNFVQRGEPACFSKFARAKAAVLSSADLVLELPLPWALSSAEGFACAAVQALAATGVVNVISFGSEEGDIERLRRCAEALLNSDMDALIKIHLNKGFSYAAARQYALEEKLGDDAALISSPNNILAIEYIKALISQHPEIKPVTIKRKGSNHDEMQDVLFPSASYLRSRLISGEDLKNYVPNEALEVYQNEVEQGRGPVTTDSLEIAILSRLRLLDASDFSIIPDSGDGAGNRLFKAVQSCSGIESMLIKAKTKRYAASRLRRMLMCAALGVTQDIKNLALPYLRVLAANERGRALLKEMSDRASLPVITKPSTVNALDGDSQKIFGLESRATDLFVLGYRTKEEKYAGSDYKTSPFMGT